MKLTIALRTAATVALLAAAPIAATAQQAQEGLRIYFDLGSARIVPEEQTTLDQAARLFREGNPFVMIVAGAADTTGNPVSNLALSVERARAVAQGLADRGIPADRLQVLGRGNSELPVETGEEVANRENRVVEITWR